MDIQVASRLGPGPLSLPDRGQSTFCEGTFEMAGGGCGAHGVSDRRSGQIPDAMAQPLHGERELPPDLPR